MRRFCGVAFSQAKKSSQRLRVAPCSRKSMNQWAASRAIARVSVMGTSVAGKHFAQLRERHGEVLFDGAHLCAELLRDGINLETFEAGQLEDAASRRREPGELRFDTVRQLAAEGVRFR